MAAQGVIVAGGLGTRMKGFSALPKALLDIDGEPLVGRQLRWLAAGGVTDVFFCLGHQAADIAQAFGDGSRWGVKLTVVTEESPRGTAGAVRDLGARVTGDLVVVYGDLVVEMDLARLLRFHRDERAAATLVVRPTDHPHDSDLVDAHADGRVAGIHRGHPKGPEPIAATALWVVRPEILELAPADRPSDFARDVFPAALEGGLRLMACPLAPGETVFDVGTPERFQKWKARARPAS